MNNPSAVFDTLYIGSRLEKKINDFSMYEIQFFCYFGCLLSIYDANPFEQWNYTFVRTDLGSPYSSDVHKAINSLMSNESLIEVGSVPGYYKLSTKGRTYLANLTRVSSSLSSRITYLDAACSSLSLLPIGSIKEAINNEPVLKSARLSIARKNLLEDSSPATVALHSQFRSLKIALEDKYSDLIVPAVVWIEALNSKETI